MMMTKKTRHRIEHKSSSEPTGYKLSKLPVNSPFNKPFCNLDVIAIYQH